jgi:hypothetical protein
MAYIKREGLKEEEVVVVVLEVMLSLSLMLIELKL